MRFGYRALYAYEKITGRSAITDFSEMQASSVSITLMVNLLRAGFEAGYYDERMTIDFDEFDIVGWMDEIPTLFQDAMTLFSESFAKAEKKNQARRPTTKTAE